MGFLGAVGAVVGAIGSAVGAMLSGASAVCGALGGVVGALGSTFCTSLAAGITALGVGDVIAVIMAVAKVVSWIAEKLGFTTEDEQPEDLGMKAEQADKKPEDFDSIEEYIKYLRKEVEIDKEKMEKLSPEEKAKYAAVGSAILVQGIEEKYKMQLPAEFWCTVADKNMDKEQIKCLLDTFKEKGMTDMKDLDDYLNNRKIESGTPRSEISDTIIEAIKKQNPGISQEDIDAAFDKMMTEHQYRK